MDMTRRSGGSPWRPGVTHTAYNIALAATWVRRVCRIGNEEGRREGVR